MRRMRLFHSNATAVAMSGQMATVAYRTRPVVYFETALAFRVDRRHGIASAHFTCPSKPSDVAIAR